MQESETKRSPNPDAAGWPQDDFSRDLGHAAEPVDHGDATEEVRLLANHEPLPEPLADLDRDARETLPILVEGTQLRQGSVYVDLDRLDAGPFRAIGGQRVEPGQRLVPKHRLEYDTWNRLVGDRDEARVVRPDEAG